MRITEIKYQRVKNLGNYETERVEMTGAVNENEPSDIVFRVLKQLTEKYLELESENEP